MPLRAYTFFSIPQMPAPFRHRWPKLLIARLHSLSRVLQILI